MCEHRGDVTQQIVLQSFYCAFRIAHHRLDVAIRGRAESPSNVWCWGIIFDRTATDRELRWLPVSDEITWEYRRSQAGREITSDHVVDALAELFAIRGALNHICSDIGPEFTANEL